MKSSYFLLSIVICLAVFLIPSSVNADIAEITAVVPGCGNNLVEFGEQCDDADLGGATCISQGFTGGFLFCAPVCTFDTSSCTLGGGGSGGGRPNIKKDLEPKTGCKIADFNCDRYVNIFDLSILLYYLEHSDQNITLYDLSKNGKVNFTDISILFYYWDTV